jgi:hypothetical protein
MRVILVQLFQDCWYNHLDRRLTAYQQLNDQQLRHAISLATAIAKGDVAILEKLEPREFALASENDCPPRRPLILKSFAERAAIMVGRRGINSGPKQNRSKNLSEKQRDGITGSIRSFALQ